MEAEMQHVIHVPTGTFVVLMLFAFLGLLGAVVHVANWLF